MHAVSESPRSHQYFTLMHMHIHCVCIVCAAGASPWEECNKKLGVLVPGCGWRLGVPMGNLGKCHGFCIDEYADHASTRPPHDACTSTRLHARIRCSALLTDSCAVTALHAVCCRYATAGTRPMSYAKMPAILYFREDEGARPLIEVGT
jgi:hypothetical protein